jgi:hypothetical protein
MVNGKNYHFPQITVIFKILKDHIDTESYVIKKIIISEIKKMIFILEINSQYKNIVSNSMKITVKLAIAR